MSYKKLSHLIVAVAAASSMAAQPQPASKEADTGATAVSANAGAADLSGQLASAFSQTPVGDVSVQAQSANVKLAAVSSSNEILGAVRARKSNLGMQQTEVSEWVLVLIGAFLIWTMSQRRTRSTLD